MIYSAKITTVKNTTKASPKETILKINQGLIYKVEINFPPGPSGLVGVQIYDGNLQLWPTTEGEWFTGDNRLYSWNERYLKGAPPYEFRILSYNLDDTYSHDIICALGCVSNDVYMGAYLPGYGQKPIEEIIAEIAKTEEQTTLERRAELFEFFGEKEAGVTEDGGD